MTADLVKFICLKKNYNLTCTRGYLEFLVVTLHFCSDVGILRA